MSLNLYPTISHDTDVSPNNGDKIDEFCHAIYKACKGFGTNGKALTEVLGSMSPTDRWLVSRRYPEIFKGKDLYKLIKSETSGDWGTLCQLLSCTPEEAEARMIQKATTGLTKKKRLIYSLVCGRSNADLELLKKTYYNLFGNDLVSALEAALGSGTLRTFVLNCAKGKEETFDPKYHTKTKAMEDGRLFLDAIQGDWSNHENELLDLICFSPIRHLKNVKKVLDNKSNHSLWRLLDDNLDGIELKAVEHTLWMKLKPYTAMALQIEMTMEGMGTDELGLSCCMIRYQRFMGDVETAFFETYGKSLKERIEGETSFKYKTLLVMLADYPGEQLCA